MTQQLSLLDFSQLPVSEPPPAVSPPMTMEAHTAKDDDASASPSPAMLATTAESGDDSGAIVTTGDDYRQPLVKIVFPANATWLAAPAGQWKRLGTGEIEVTYYSKDELQWSINMSKWAKECEHPKPVTLDNQQISMFEQAKTNYSEGL